MQIKILCIAVSYRKNDAEIVFGAEDQSNVFAVVASHEQADTIEAGASYLLDVSKAPADDAKA